VALVTDVVITQPNYLPWRGYFDQMERADRFILLNDVQYTRRDWRNRNRLKSPDGLRWITIPVARGHRDQRIDEAIISDRGWAQSHLDRARHCYADAPRAEGELAWLENLLIGAAAKDALAAVLGETLRRTAAHVGITTEIIDCQQLLPTSESVQLGATERLVTLAQRAGASRYLSGPSARDYLDVQPFREQGIDVAWLDYSGYRPYPQLHGRFEPAVSIVDVLVHLGAAEAASAWKGGGLVPAP
jgi:hypothetical protein